MSFTCSHVHRGIRCQNKITKISGKYLRSKMIVELSSLMDSENTKRSVIDRIAVQGFQWLCKSHYNMVKKMDIEKMQNKQLKIAYVGDDIHKLMWKTYSDKLKKIGFIDGCVNARDCNGHISFFANPISGKWCFNGKFKMFDMNKYFISHINLPSLSSNSNSNNNINASYASALSSNSNSNNNINASYAPALSSNSNSNNNINASYTSVHEQSTVVSQQRFAPIVEVEDRTEYGNKEKGKPSEHRRQYNHDEIITYCHFLQFESGFTGVRDAIKYFKEDQTNAVSIYMDDNHGYVRKAEGYGKMYKLFIGTPNPKHRLLNEFANVDDEKNVEFNKDVKKLWTEITRAKNAVRQRQLGTHNTGSSSESAIKSAKSGAKKKKGFVAPPGAPGGPNQSTNSAKTKITKNSIQMDKLEAMRDSNKAKNAMVLSINKLGHNETDKKSLADVVYFVENNKFVDSGADLQMDVWTSIDDNNHQYIMLWRTITDETTVVQKTSMIIAKYKFLKKVKEKRQNK
eukprot:248875_1